MNSGNDKTKYDIYADISGIDNSIYNKLKRIFTSTVFFIIAYLFVYSINHYFTAGLLIFFDYSPKITFNDFHNLPFHYSFWTKERITVIYSGGPFLCLIIGLITYYYSKGNSTNLFKLFLFWLYVCFINLFLALIIFSPFGIGRYESEMYKYFAIVISWWRIENLTFVPITILAAFLSIVTGYVLRNELLKFSFSGRISNTIKGRNLIVRQFFIFPLILGAPIVFSLSTHESVRTHIFLFSNLFIISAGFFLKNEYDLITRVKARKEDILNKVPIIEICFLIALYVFIFFYLR
jgi:hypothetical protein